MDMENLALYTNEFLNEQRQSGDVAADEFILRQFSDPEAKKRLRTWLNRLENNMQLESTASGDSFSDTISSSDLIRNARQLPRWADPTLMKRGSAFFAAHAEAIMSLLGLLSLPYCYAAADGAMVLQLSERMRTDTGRRLFETADFVWAVMAPEAFGRLGKGFSSILQVRINHAAARYYTLQNEDWENSLGVPLNQEDMAGTNLSLSLIVIRGLRKLGYTIQYEEQFAFIHVWNVVGSLLGIHDDLLPNTGKEAQLLEAMIRKRQFKPSTQGQSLTKSLTNYLSSSLQSSSINQPEVLGLMRFLLGDEVAKLLNLSAPQLSTNKIRLLKALNLFNGLKGDENSISAYHQALRKFRLQKQASIG
ncbi:MAG: hypothetical protein JWQ28_1522 [Pedobacter sp.]|jgi:hypothetical protein|nr:hypothetical protein [Pedobacter sp.]